MKPDIKYYLGYKFCSTNSPNYIPDKKLYLAVDGNICEIAYMAKSLFGNYFIFIYCKNKLGGTFPINADAIKFISNDLNKIKKYLMLK